MKSPWTVGPPVFYCDAGNISHNGVAGPAGAVAQCPPVLGQDITEILSVAVRHSLKATHSVSLPITTLLRRCNNGGAGTVATVGGSACAPASAVCGNDC